MNILLLSGTQLLPIHGWYQFYNQLALYMQKRGIPTSLHCAYWHKECIDTVENELYSGVLVPDYGSFNTEKNIGVLVYFMEEKKIDVVFSLNLLPAYISKFLFRVKRKFPFILLFDLLHSCPNLSVQNKKIILKETSFGEIDSFKIFLQWLFPSVYLLVLQAFVNRRAKISYRLFDKTVLLSPSYVREYESMIGFDCDNKVVAIPNSRPVIKNLIPIEDKKKEILFVGRLSQEKGLHRLLAIWEFIYKDLSDWTFVIVGDGPMELKYKQLAYSIGLERVIFEGYQDAIPYIDRASILCLSSNIEGLPTVFVEAMSLGVVPIGFNTFSAINDMIDNGINGYIIPAFNIEEYAQTLKQIALDNTLRCELAYEAQKKAWKYDIENVGKLWLDLFSDTNVI